jgi:hypothetical protein
MEVPLQKRYAKNRLSLEARFFKSQFRPVCTVCSSGDTETFKKKRRTQKMS